MIYNYDEFILENLLNIRIKSYSKIWTNLDYQYLTFDILKWNTKIGEFNLSLEFDKNEDDIYKIDDCNFDIGVYGFEIYEQYRSKGIGKFSFGKILEYIENNLSSYRTIYLSVFSNNTSAIKIYEYYGFSKIEDDGKIIKMEKNNTYT
jgi:RimJ/RimL family protein N-acetyltransferase